MSREIGDFLGKSGLDSTNKLDVNNMYKDIIVKGTKSKGLRNFENFEILLKKAKEFSNGPRVTPEGVDKLIDYLKRGNAETKFGNLGLKNMQRSDVRELEEILTYEEAEKDVMPEEDMENT